MTKKRKLFPVDLGVLQALYEYSRQSGVHLDDLCDEALRDLLKKKGQPASLKEALERSARVIAANDARPAAPRNSAKPGRVRRVKKKSR
jgi:hypothetical protein